jgi:Mce-associated membrane protein
MIAARSARLRTTWLAGIPVGYAAVGVVVAALLAVAGVLGAQCYRDVQTDRGRTAAVDAANKAAGEMFAYDYNTAAKTLPAAADDLTPNFRREYLSLVNTTIVKGAQEKQVSVHVDVRGSSVVSASSNDVTVLMFLDQTTIDQDNPRAVVLPSRLRMDMRKLGGRWLVNDVTPI